MHYTSPAARAGEELIRLNSSAPWTVQKSHLWTLPVHAVVGTQSQKLHSINTFIIIACPNSISYTWIKIFSELCM